MKATVLIVASLATFIYFGYVSWSFQQYHREYEEIVNRYPESLRPYVDYFYLDMPYPKILAAFAVILAFMWILATVAVVERKFVMCDVLMYLNHAS